MSFTLITQSNFIYYFRKNLIVYINIITYNIIRNKKHVFLISLHHRRIIQPGGVLPDPK